MHGHLVTAFVLSTTMMMAIRPARSDEIPSLKVEQLCRGIASISADPLAGGEPSVTFERCMQAEQADREQLRKEWSPFSPDDKKHCVAEAKEGGESSYTELVTCLEMALEVKRLRSSAKSVRINR
jgi:hypothetical protein